jgi:alpha-L-glutamate ligase-like protein
MIFGLARKLREAGVLGMNQRNADYIMPYNKRQYYPLVDNKEKTKKLAISAGIAVPELYHVIEIERQIKDLPAALEPHSEFVIKPAQGSGGDGIMVITGRRKGMYRKASGILIHETELQHHVSNVLSGMYSLGGQNDTCLIEYLVKFDDIFSNITYLGVPDIRIIVFLGVPVMAMVRLPTRLSDGKANLHQGAIGAGIDIATGKTLTAVWRNDIITEHPDTGNEVSDILVPYWNTILEIASRCHQLSGLGYLGVDIVLDKEKGPLMLEMNARPGLNIQIANNCGLNHRLQKIRADIGMLKSMEDKLNFARHYCSCNYTY